MPTAFIGLGSNLGEREQHLEAALADLAGLPGTRVARVSSMIESAPVGAPQGSGAFLNAVARLETSLAPRELLAGLLEIERTRGRDRAGQPRNAPRTLDLDLLLYGDAVIAQADLQVPHPRMHERHFVLWPLLQIEPKARDPRTGELFADVLARLPGKA
jgi:2-amino-4-hydroxy-6-hydroxymethyldihydropteridine diphosphokinase